MPLGKEAPSFFLDRHNSRLGSDAARYARRTPAANDPRAIMRRFARRRPSDLSSTCCRMASSRPRPANGRSSRGTLPRTDAAAVVPTPRCRELPAPGMETWIWNARLAQIHIGGCAGLRLLQGEGDPLFGEHGHLHGDGLLGLACRRTPSPGLVRLIGGTSRVLRTG